MTKTAECECGEWSGVPCAWSGPASERVQVEFMPEQHRESHTAGGACGTYPANGARRIWVARDCADFMIDMDLDWVRALSLPFCACGRRLHECDGSRAGCKRHTR